MKKFKTFGLKNIIQPPIRWKLPTALEQNIWRLLKLSRLFSNPSWELRQSWIKKHNALWCKFPFFSGKYNLVQTKPGNSSWSLTIQKQPPGMLCKKGVFKNLANFTGTHLCWSLFFHKVPGRRPATLLKKRLRHRCFPVNFAKFLRKAFL